MTLTSKIQPSSVIVDGKKKDAAAHVWKIPGRAQAQLAYPEDVPFEHPGESFTITGSFTARQQARAVAEVLTGITLDGNIAKSLAAKAWNKAASKLCISDGKAATSSDTNPADMAKYSECILEKGPEIVKLAKGKLAAGQYADLARAVGKIATVAAKVNVVLTAGIKTIKVGDSITTALYDESARQVTVNVKPITDKRPTRAALMSAEVPADCKLPKQRLKHGKTTKGSPGGGTINYEHHDKMGFADFAHRGDEQILTEYTCSAGGAGWPQTLILIGRNGDLLASFDLKDIRPEREHSDVTAVKTNKHGADISWDSYEGAGFAFIHHKARISYDSGKLKLSRHTMTYTPAAVAEEVTTAASKRKRSKLKDSSVINDRLWKKLTKDPDYKYFTVQTCTTSGATQAVYHGAIDTEKTMTLSKAPGTSYGWQVTSIG